MDRFTDSFLSEVSPDKALQHRLRAEVILGRSLLAKHQAGQHDQSTHGSWATETKMRIIPSTKDVQIPWKANVREYKEFLNNKELQNNMVLNGIMSTWRRDFSVSRAMSQIIAGDKPAPEFDNESTRKEAQILKEELDSSPSFGIPSYRTARLTSDVGSSANVGDALSFNASSVAFSPVDAMAYMSDELTPLFRNKGQGKFLFEFPSTAKGIVYDDSVTYLKETFKTRPVEGIVRGKFKVSKIVERLVYDPSLRKDVKVKIHILESLETLTKHQAGKHDQRTHGSWAGGGAGVDITKDMDGLFYNSDGKLNQETQNVINEIIIKSSVGKESGDIALKIIAERQGFTGLPKTVKTITELKQLQEAEGGTLVYRGLSDYSADSAQRNENTGNVSYSAKQGVTDFRQGDYHAGYGAFGTGIYSTVKPDEASSYSNHEDEDSGSLGNGKVMAMHIPKNAKMPTKEQVQSAMKLVNYDVIQPTHRNNVARVLVSQGFQAYNAGFIQDDKGDYFVILDRSMLTVADQDWTFGL
jgi:hypothetical protein